MWRLRPPPFLGFTLVSQRVREVCRSAQQWAGDVPASEMLALAALLPLCLTLLDLSLDPFQDSGRQMKPLAGSVNRTSVQKPSGSLTVAAFQLPFHSFPLLGNTPCRGLGTWVGFDCGFIRGLLPRPASVFSGPALGCVLQLSLPCFAGQFARTLEPASLGLNADSTRSCP